MWHTLNLSYARSKNLTPYDVLTIASMVEGEAQVPSERPLVAAVIYNRLHQNMPLGIDATLRYGLHIKPTQSLTQSDLANPTPYNTRLHDGLPPTPINNPGMAVARGGRASGARRLPLLRAQARSQAPLLHVELPGLPQPRGGSTATEVVLLGHPVAHSLSPRMQNAAFAAVGLDWQYVLRDVVSEELEAAVAEVEYANVTAPYKLDVARILGSELPSVNTIVRGQRLLDGRRDPRASNNVVTSRRSWATAGRRRRSVRRCRRRASSRGAAQWPPEVRDADLVIHATPVRDEVLFELSAGQTLIDLPYPRTATAEAAAAAGARVLDGLEVLVAQGRREFRALDGSTRTGGRDAQRPRLDLSLGGA